MPVRATLLALLVFVSAASAVELKTVKGEVVKGDVVSIDAKEIVLSVDGENKPFSIKQIAMLDYAVPTKLPATTVFHDLELTDGTVLHCSELQFKVTSFFVKLLGDGAAIKIPMEAVANVLWNAQDADHRQEWTKRVAIKRNFDGLGILSKKSDKPDQPGETDIINVFEYTILSADAAGETINVQKGTEKKSFKLGNQIGLYFARKLDPNAPPTLCKLLDASNSVLMAAEIELKNGDLHVKTSSGVAVVYKPAQLVRLDYSTANLAYLSDLTPSKVVETLTTEDPFQHYRRDHNLENNQIRLLGVAYNKGLALHSRTELEFKLKGEYRTLEGVAGIDDNVDGHNRPVQLKIYVDTQEKPIYERSFTRKNQKERVDPIRLNIKDVQVLRIVVSPVEPDFLDMGLHLDLADIRVIK